MRPSGAEAEPVFVDPPGTPGPPWKQRAYIRPLVSSLGALSDSGPVASGGSAASLNWGLRTALLESRQCLRLGAVGACRRECYGVIGLGWE